jgi:hypothetical protein
MARNRGLGAFQRHPRIGKTGRTVSTILATTARCSAIAWSSAGAICFVA